MFVRKRLVSAICLVSAAMLGGCLADGAPGSSAAGEETAAAIARGQDCRFITGEEAAASAGIPNVTHSGVRLDPQPAPSTDPNDAIAVRANIPRSAQPPLTASQKRILVCSYEFDLANQPMSYVLFVPKGYDPGRRYPLIVNLHGAGVQPLQQMLFDGTTDFAERDGYIVVAPLGYSTMGGWGPLRGAPRPVETADINPATGSPYAVHELSEADALEVLARVRRTYSIDDDRIYLMGHSMGAFGAFYLGARHNRIWAGIAPIAGGGIGPNASAEALKSIPLLILHGSEDVVVSPNTSRRAAMELQKVGAQHIYLEFPGREHEFWIRRGRENLEKVFMFFNTVSRSTNRGPITDDMIVAPPARN